MIKLTLTRKLTRQRNWKLQLDTPTGHCLGNATAHFYKTVETVCLIRVSIDTVFSFSVQSVCQDVVSRLFV